ncbi:MAG TPA: alanine dehydrogenase [Baekduia sp.]|nr:alanine dehydrogenase [Baekduia sp.]
MRVGLVAEIKPGERRCALTPVGARELSEGGHEVLVQAGAGVGAGFEDIEYERAGAQLVSDASTVWAQAELLLKVKEPIAAEYGQLRAGQVLFTYLHLAADRPLTDALLQSGTTALAYETITDLDGRLPLLAPMSEVAGRLAAQAAAYFMQDPFGGRGLLMGGVPGVAPARVTILGGGVVGTQSAKVACGMGADVTILDRSLPRLRELDDLFNGRVRVVMSSAAQIEAELQRSDVVIGAVLVPGVAAPQLVTREMLTLLPPRAVLVDVAIDQGGCFATSRPTTHAEPTFDVDGIVHYCVANMPGAVPRTSTLALTNATLPYIRRIAEFGLDELIAADPGVGLGVNVRDGRLVYEPLVAAMMPAA